MRNIESVGEMSSIDVTVPFPLERKMRGRTLPARCRAAEVAR
jgi:hypothetical protein